jgi:hypothetical protein
MLREKLQTEKNLKDRTQHSVDTIMEMVSVCVNNTYFQFGGDFYKQVKGMAMGSPLSPVLCNIYLEYLEQKAIESFEPKPRVFLRYVDDIYLEWQQDTRPVEELLQHFNNQCEETKFTIEKEENDCLPFLDVRVKRKNNKIVTEVYRKPTDSGLILQYDSNHPLTVKKGLVNTLLHRATTHCSNVSIYNDEIKKVEAILLENKYPLKLIQSIKKARDSKKDIKREEKKPQATIKLPYIPSLSEKIKRIGSKHNIRMVSSSQDTLRSHLVKFKPKAKVMKKELIYKIPCECSKSYIGETGRTLEVRLSEHKRSLKKGDPELSKLCEHHFYTGHRFLWEQAKVIGQEKNWRARKVHEAGEIMRGGKWVISAPSFNIDPVWRPMIKSMKFSDMKVTKKKKSNENTVKVRRSQRIIEKNNQVIAQRERRGARVVPVMPARPRQPRHATLNGPLRQRR